VRREEFGKKHSEFQMGIEARAFQTLLGCFFGPRPRRTGKTPDRDSARML